MLSLANVTGLVKLEAASDEEIRTIEKQMNISFPEDYKNLLKMTNGFSTNKGLVIFGTKDIIERNLTLEVEKYANDFMAIGDDSGDILFLIAKESGNIISLDSGDMNPKNAKYIASSISKWLDNDCNLDEKGEKTEDKIHNYSYSIILTSFPGGGVKDLVKIKKILNIQMSSAELLSATKNVPYSLIGNISYGKATNYIKNLSEFKDVIKLEKTV